MGYTIFCVEKTNKHKAGLYMFWARTSLIVYLRLRSSSAPAESTDFSPFSFLQNLISWLVNVFNLLFAGITYKKTRKMLKFFINFINFYYWFKIIQTVSPEIEMFGNRTVMESLKSILQVHIYFKFHTRTVQHLID